MNRLYRLLLSLYPARFREEYAQLMERQFREDYRETRGAAARAWFVLQALSDLAITLPGEIAREFGRDVRYSFRSYRQRPLVTASVVVALALAIGSATGVFSVVNAVLIRSLPFRDSDRLVELWRSPWNIANGRAAFREAQARSSYLQEAAGYASNEVNLTAARSSARVQLAETTANFLALLGSEPELGRGFATEEDIPGRNAVAIIGYGLWQQMFGGDSRVLGSTVRLNEVPVTVVGVAPRGLDYPAQASVWTPTLYDLQRIPKSGAFSWQTIGRLKPGIGLAEASTRFQAEVQRANAGRKRLKIEGYSANPELFSLRDQLAGPVRSAALVLMGMVVFVLLVACANLAHLLLSRTTERRRELAIRSALGASRARLLQQLATEAFVLTGIAALAGCAVAYSITQLAGAAAPAPVAALSYRIVDWRVIGFATGLAVFTAVLFGLFPASLIARQPIGMQGSSRGPATSRMRAILIAMQATLTVALLAGAFTMGRSFLTLLHTDLGFHTSQLVTASISLAGTRYESDTSRRQYYYESLERLRSVPGIEAAAAVSYLPLIPKMFMGGRVKLIAGAEVVAPVIAASPGYFRTMATEILEGREFNESDRSDSNPVVVLSDKLAHALAPGSLTGRSIDLTWRPGSSRAATIIGVVRSQRYSGPAYGGGPEIFFPIEQAPPQFVTFVAKVRGPADAYIPAVRGAVQQTDAAVPVYDVKTLDRRLADTLARPRFFTAAVLFFAVFAFLLALIGTYGVATYAVSQRTQEIGVRLAVGASPRRVRWMLLREGLVPVAAGLLAGVLSASSLGQVLQHLIANASPVSPWISFGEAFLLAAVLAGTIWSATNRILRMDPTAVLKSE
jgi:putative ABC transport system permease protein